MSDAATNPIVRKLDHIADVVLAVGKPIPDDVLWAAATRVGITRGLAIAMPLVAPPLRAPAGATMHALVKANDRLWVFWHDELAFNDRQFYLLLESMLRASEGCEPSVRRAAK